MRYINKEIFQQIVCCFLYHSISVVACCAVWLYDSPIAYPLCPLTQRNKDMHNEQQQYMWPPTNPHIALTPSCDLALKSVCRDSSMFAFFFNITSNSGNWAQIISIPFLHTSHNVWLSPIRTQSRQDYHFIHTCAIICMLLCGIHSFLADPPSVPTALSLIPNHRTRDQE